MARRIGLLLWLVLLFHLSLLEIVDASTAYVAEYNSHAHKNDRLGCAAESRPKEKILQNIVVNGDQVVWYMPKEKKLAEIYELASDSTGLIDASEYSWRWEPGRCYIKFKSGNYNGHLLTIYYRSTASVSYAEMYIEHLAKQTRPKWLFSTLRALVIAGSLVYLGDEITATNDVDKKEYKSEITIGSALVGSGYLIWDLSTRGRVYEGLNRIQSISDIDEKERVGYEILADLAGNARLKRTVYGILGVALSISIISLKQNQSSGKDMELGDRLGEYTIGTFVGLAALSELLIESKEERAFEDFLKELTPEEGIGYRIEVSPFATGGKLTFLYRF